jgi:hypothetical protein
MATKNIVPRATGEGNIGTTLKHWVKGWFDSLYTAALTVGSLTGVLRADAGVVSVDSDVTDLVTAASEGAAGKIEIATQAEVTTGTDDLRAITPLKLATAVPASSSTAAGKIEIAIKAEQETGTDNTRCVSPAVQHYHESACKGWGKATGAGALTVGYNMDAVTDTGVGRLGVNITTDMSSADYAILTSLTSVATTLTVATVDNGGLIYNASQAAGAFGIWDYDDTATTHVAQDPQTYFWAIFGDLSA